MFLARLLLAPICFVRKTAAIGEAGVPGMLGLARSMDVSASLFDWMLHSGFESSHVVEGYIH